MTGFIEDMLLRQEGLDDKDIADINASLPEIQHLDEVLQKEWAGISKLVPIFARIVGKIINKQRSLT